MATLIPVASPVDFDRYGAYGVKSRPAADGGFQRSPYLFRGRITADGRSVEGTVTTIAVGAGRGGGGRSGHRPATTRR
jgi:hypothetical protein